MLHKTAVAAVILLCFALKGAAAKTDLTSITAHVVTEDIQAGIEKHIEDEARRAEGYFRFFSDGKEHKFKLVRVHTEYLANLGPKRHFACVDLVDTTGDVYDVDFFLSGDPGAMTVTETTLHKLNGVPFYTWKQNKKGTWERLSIKEASPKLLGVIYGEDQFEFLYRIKLPVIDKTARMWIPYPTKDSFQKVDFLGMNPPLKYEMLKEEKHGNQIFYFELSPKESKQTIDLRYQIKRKEKKAYTPLSEDWKKSLEAEQRVPIDGKLKKIADKVVQGKKGDLVRARLLYDHVLDHMRYIKAGSGWGEGDALYACDAAKGNCTDFHSYFIALSRAAGIPARFAIGASIPSDRNNGGTDGYHCWAEFYAEGKWWPVDISEADKYSSLSTYYFGHNPANRIEFSRGRDLILSPGPASGPINFLADPVLEINGKQVKNKPQFFFLRNKS